ncbi:hypothetical protein RhiJN_09561 [Ceratobasidium sp. AG-Ba]|nr:hypothetical protein RhiJN_09561 [Ceratobasidium sp. AG-Ba]
MATAESERHVTVRLPLDDDKLLTESRMTVADFQNSYMKERIDTHAMRVAYHRLAPAPLVCRDIINTITEVWKSMPNGFGAASIERITHLRLDSVPTARKADDPPRPHPRQSVNYSMATCWYDEQWPEIGVFGPKSQSWNPVRG